jgi:hypothetical protein
MWALSSLSLGYVPPKRAAGEMTKLQYRDFGIDRQGITLVLALTVLALLRNAAALWIGLR